MKISDIIRPETINDSVLIGYYGGGNYGDELLLEVLQNLCAQAGVQNLTIAYQRPRTFHTYHHDFGYRRVDGRDKRAVLRSIIRSKRIVVGGGGLWGLDFGFNVFLLSMLLAASRWILRKDVYLLGVGYYKSTTRLGHIGAWLAGKSANRIFARDAETLDNFRAVNSCTYLDTDIAWYIRGLNLGNYRADVQQLDKLVQVRGKTLLIALRRFQAKHGNHFTDQVERFIQNNRDKQIIVTLLEPKHIDPEQHKRIQKWARTYGNVQALLEPHNPLALFLFFRKHRSRLALIAPQFHAIITAHLNDVPFMPIVYDNKVAELLSYIGQSATIPIRSVLQTHLQLFADNFYRGAA